MVALSTAPWTMDVALSRKRSRLALDDDDDCDDHRPEPSPALSISSDGLKRSRTQNELDELDIFTPEEAWAVDVDGILGSNTLPKPPGSSMQPYNNVSKYSRDASIFILCVQGNLHLHYDLLW